MTALQWFARLVWGADRPRPSRERLERQAADARRLERAPASVLCRYVAVLLERAGVELTPAVRAELEAIGDAIDQADVRDERIRQAAAVSAAELGLLQHLRDRIAILTARVDGLEAIREAELTARRRALASSSRNLHN